jgi:hypothetical protein
MLEPGEGGEEGSQELDPGLEGNPGEGAGEPAGGEPEGGGSSGDLGSGGEPSGGAPAEPAAPAPDYLVRGDLDGFMQQMSAQLSNSLGQYDKRFSDFEQKYQQRPAPAAPAAPDLGRIPDPYEWMANGGTAESHRMITGMEERYNRGLKEVKDEFTAYKDAQEKKTYLGQVQRQLEAGAQAVYKAFPETFKDEKAQDWLRFMALGHAAVYGADKTNLTKMGMDMDNWRKAGVRARVAKRTTDLAKPKGPPALKGAGTTPKKGKEKYETLAEANVGAKEYMERMAAAQNL